jgi:hypothetical protein
MYDPATGKFTLISTCFPTHHLIFAEDANNTLWTSGGRQNGAIGYEPRFPGNGPRGGDIALRRGLDALPFPRTTVQGRQRVRQRRSELLYWVDQFDAFGLGKNVPIATGNLDDALLALVDGKFLTLRVPYPIGYFTKWMDGRIDDPNAGWKGKALWSTYSTTTMFHLETGKGTLPKVVRFQLRPGPLVR